MRALEYYRSVPRYLLMKALGKRRSARWASTLAPLRMIDRDPPALPGTDWVRVRPTLTGICGSDLSALIAGGSPYFAPLTSMPFVMGHEVVGIVEEKGDAVTDLPVGTRVVLRPALGCSVRGIDPVCPACQRGDIALCKHVTDGTISSGIQTGFCRDTGGGWSESFVAQHAQLFPVPAELTDETAVLIEPFACALHAALRAQPAANDTVLVVGCGAIGLMLIAALRWSGSRARILAVARYGHQQEQAAALGADIVLAAERTTSAHYKTLANALGTKVYPNEIGKPTVLGGADIVYDCVGSSASIDDCIRFTRAGGSLVLVGMPGIPKNIDWTPLWYQEMKLLSAYAYGTEPTPNGPRETFDYAIDLATQNAAALRPLMTHTFPLTDHWHALKTAFNTGTYRAVKTTLHIGSAR